MASAPDKKNLKPANHRRRRRSLGWQIMSIAAIGTFGFFVFLSVTLKESKERADLLTEIRDVRYPAQEKLLAAHHGLEYIDSNLEQAIATSNASLLEHSMTLASQFRSYLHTAMELENSRVSDLKEILSNFDDYYHRSHTLALSVIAEQSSPSSITREKQIIAAKFNNVLGALGAMQTEQTEFLVQSVDTATSRAHESLRVGITTGLLTAALLFLVGLFTARSILQRINHMVSSLRQIATGNGDMNVRIPLTGSDEMTELAYWFNTFIEKLQKLTTDSTTEIKRLAYTDPLTSLPNRRMFLNCLNEEIEHISTDGKGKSLAVMFLDIDNFKPINDQFGHETGDVLLQVVARRLLECVRTTETTAEDQLTSLLDHRPGDAVVARIAGDEFLIAISNLDNNGQVEAVARRVRDSIMQPISIDGNECSVGVSIGLCLYPQYSDDTNTLISRADMAMYEAKNNGKNRYRFYDPALKEASDLQTKLNEAVKTAIEHDELCLLFQPVFNLQSGQLQGAEALLRWSGNELGTFTPAQFISIAEANGSICDIDDWVLQSVIEQLAEWEACGIAPITISLNFSASQASRTDLAESVTRIAADKPHLMQLIEIEITETSAIENINVVENNILELKQRGIGIAMDDFGAGHSSLTLLTRCPIDTLKIDQQITRQIKSDGRSRVIAQSMIDLAASLEVSVCAEGIEDEEQAQVLAEMNCKLGQGFYFSEPLNNAELTTLMEVQNRNQIRLIDNNTGDNINRAA